MQVLERVLEEVQLHEEYDLREGERLFHRSEWHSKMSSLRTLASK